MEAVPFPAKMRSILLVFLPLIFFGANVFSQADPWQIFTIKAGVCEGERIDITLVARRSVLKQFIEKEIGHFGTCSSHFTPTDDFLKTASSAAEPPGGDGNRNEIWIKDPGQFIAMYKFEKKAKVSSEICVDTDGKASFTVGTDDAKIGIDTKGKFSISAKTSDGITHTAEF
jgi:hypothetical protein